MEAAVQMRQERMRDDCDNAGVPVPRRKEGAREIPAYLLVRTRFVHENEHG